MAWLVWLMDSNGPPDWPFYQIETARKKRDCTGNHIEYPGTLLVRVLDWAPDMTRVLVTASCSVLNILHMGPRHANIRHTK